MAADETKKEQQPLPALPAEMSLTTTPSHLSQALPTAWIERLFARMVAMYGSRFADMWGGTNQAEVKATWAESLRNFDAETLRRALELLLKNYEYPPSLPQFYNLCKAQQKPESLTLEAPRVPMPDYVREQLAVFKRKHVVRPYIDHEEADA